MFVHQCIWILSASLILGSDLSAQSLTYQTAEKISGSTDFNISVYPRKAAYAGTGSYSGNTGIFGDGTVEAYRFWRSTPPIQNGGTEESYVEFGGLLSDITQSDVAGFAEFDRADVWTLSDPGTDFSGGDPADYGGTNLTISGAYNVSGTLDVSKLVSGTMYFLCGSYDTAFQVGLTMSGAGQTNITANMTPIDPPTDRNVYVIVYTFTNESMQYETITYAYTGSAGNRARWMGVVVDAEGPPKGTVVILH
jgi:hypothetical protein